MPVTQPDVTGGYGSFPQSLLGIITGGLQTVVTGEGLKRYGFSFGADGRQYSNEREGFVQAQQPAATSVTPQAAANAISNPWVLVGGLGIALIVVLLVRR